MGSTATHSGALPRERFREPLAQPNLFVPCAKAKKRLGDSPDETIIYHKPRSGNVRRHPVLCLAPSDRRVERDSLFRYMSFLLLSLSTQNTAKYSQCESKQFRRFASVRV